MYNEEIKRKFFEDDLYKKIKCGSSDVLFAELSEFESKIGKDVYQMTYEEIKEAVNSIDFLESGTLNKSISTLKSYAKWCAQNGVFNDCPGGIFAISTKDVDPAIAMEKRLFKDENSLNAAISKVRTFSDGYPEVMAAVLLWSGLTMPEVFRLRDEHINLETGVVLNEDGSEVIAELSRGFYQRLKCMPGQSLVSVIAETAHLKWFVTAVLILSSSGFARRTQRITESACPITKLLMRFTV